MELSVTDWTFPITPESGGTAFTWAQTVFGVACADSKEMNTMRIRGCIMKAFFQLSVMRTLVRYNTFLRVMRSLLNKFQYTNEQTRSVEVSLQRRRYRRDFGTNQPNELQFPRRPKTRESCESAPRFPQAALPSANAQSQQRSPLEHWSPRGAWSPLAVDQTTSLRLQPVRAWSTSPARRFCCPSRPEKKRRTERTQPACHPAAHRW